MKVLRMKILKSMCQKLIKTYYLFLNKEKGLLNQIIYTKNKQEKIDFTFDAKKHIFADSLNLQHKDFKINIKLFQITETN